MLKKYIVKNVNTFRCDGSKKVKFISLVLIVKIYEIKSEEMDQECENIPFKIYIDALYQCSKTKRRIVFPMCYVVYVQIKISLFEFL